MNALELNASYAITEGPTLAVMSLAQLKKQVRVDHDDDNTILQELAAEATLRVETDSRTLLRPVEMSMSLDRFPCAGEPIWIEWTPVSAIASVIYVGTDGADVTWDAAQYIASLNSLPPRIAPGWGRTWPAVRHQPESVRIAFTGGFATTDSPGFPLQARSAIRLLVGIWFERPDARGAIPEEFETTYRDLINGFAWGAL